MEVLSGVHTRVLRSSPGGSIDCSSAVLRAREGLPVNKKRDGILGLGDTIVRFSRSDTRSSASHDPTRDRLSLEDPTAYVDVVR